MERSVTELNLANVIEILVFGQWIAVSLDSGRFVDSLAVGEYVDERQKMFEGKLMQDTFLSFKTRPGVGSGAGGEIIVRLDDIKAFKTASQKRLDAVRSGTF